MGETFHWQDTPHNTHPVDIQELVELSKIIDKNETLRETEVDDVPESSILLLEMDYESLMHSDIHSKAYGCKTFQLRLLQHRKKHTRQLTKLKYKVTE